MGNKHTLSDLYQMQSMPLSAKIRMTKYRIKQWVDKYGEEGVYVSFSGGKDSTVLLDIVRQDYPNIPAVFVDVPTQYPELKEFVKTFENVEILKPNISFMEVCKKYGFPLLSKKNADVIEGAKRGIKNKKYNFRLNSVGFGVDEAIELGLKLPNDEMIERYKKTNGGNSKFYTPKLKYMLDAPFDVSSKCCDVMKKTPAHIYQKQTNRKPILATMACESMRRTSAWLKNGCNAFDSKDAKSNPMSFWTEQDVLLYIKLNNLPICSVYGDVVIDYDSECQLEGQMDMSELSAEFGIFDTWNRPLKTTGCSRTGCVLCGFGCHLEKPGEGRFERLKETHPGMYKLLDVIENNGVTYREAIDWINEHGNMNIRY